MNNFDKATGFNNYKPTSEQSNTTGMDAMDIALMQFSVALSKHKSTSDKMPNVLTTQFKKLNN